MTVEVKICGLRSEAAVDAAVAAGADYVGFVFCPPSPRHVEPAAARALADRARGRAAVVALLVDPDDALLRTVVETLSPDIIQLHGKESPARAGEIAARFRLPVLKAVAVAGPADAETAFAYASAGARILFDAKPPPVGSGSLPGGNGLAFDWTALDGISGRLDFMLAGGLNPENVADAVRLTGARAVDVSSGVESRPGEKDIGRIDRFIRAAKTAKQTP